MHGLHCWRCDGIDLAPATRVCDGVTVLLVPTADSNGVTSLANARRDVTCHFSDAQRTEALVVRRVSSTARLYVSISLR